MRRFAALIFCALLVVGVGLVLKHVADEGTADDDPPFGSGNPPDAHLVGRGDRPPEETGPVPPVTELGVSAPAPEEVENFLAEALENAPPDFSRDRVWLRRRSKELPGGVLALVEWFFSCDRVLSEKMATLVQRVGVRALSELEKEDWLSLRAKTSRAFESMDPATLQKWRIGREWLKYLKAKPGQFRSLSEVESVARTIAQDEPELQAELLAGAASLGCRSDMLFSDLVRLIQAGLEAHEEGEALPFDAEKVLEPSLGVLIENAGLVPDEVGQLLVRSRVPQARYAGTHLLLQSHPREVDPVVESLVRYPPENPWYDYFLVKFTKQYGQEAVEHLPAILASADFARANLMPVLGPESRRLTLRQLAAAIQEGRARWDVQQRKIVLGR